MKIMVVTPYFLPKIGGLENYAYNVAQKLRQEYGHEVFVVTSNHETNERDEITIEGLRIIRLPSTISFSNTPINFRWYYMLRRIIREEQPDAMYTHSPVPFMADMAILAAKQVPVLMTYHAGTMVKGESKLIDLVLKTYEKTVLPLLCKKAKLIGAVYPGFIKTVVADDSKLIFVPPGVDTNLFKPLPNTKKTTDLLFVGRIEHSSHWKGLDVLLDAVAMSTAALHNLRLTVVGDGDALSYYQDYAEKAGIANNVVFAGKLRGKALVKAYNTARIFVLPSTTDAEAFGTVLAEAMACGTPVIGSRIGGVPDVIAEGRTGFLVPPGEVEPLAEALQSLLSDEQTIKLLAAQCRPYVLEKYDLLALVKKVEAALQAITKPAVYQIVPKYPPALGGMENVAYEISKQLAINDWRVNVVTSNLGHTSAYTDFQQPGYRVQRLKAIEFAHLPIIFMLPYRLLRTDKHSLFHVHIAQAFIPEIARFASKLRGSSYIAHFHLDVAPSGRFGQIFVLYKRYIFPRTLRAAQKVIVFSQDQAQLVQTKYGVQASRIAIIPNGVAEAYFATARPRPSHTKPRLLFVGRLSTQKNVSQLLIALKDISSKYETTIVGDGELRPELERLAQTLNLHNVRFAGRRDGDALRESYRKADIFVLPSEREGMPLALLEALAGGLPVVATNVLGNKDLVNDDNGQLVELHDSAALASAIEALRVNPAAYGRKSTNAIASARQYSWQLLIQRVENLYQETL